MARPSWDDYMLGIARAVSLRADCTRRQVGAVIADTEHRIISTGYNGAPVGEPGCLTAGACPRGQHYRIESLCPVNENGGDHFFNAPVGHHCPSDKCACGNAWPCASYAEPGSSYDTGVGSCSSIHAEANALLYARTSVRGCTLYITDAPCDGCWRLINASRLAKVVTPNDWWAV